MSLLGKYGTIAFDVDSMCKGIRMGILRTDGMGNMALDHNGQPIFDAAPRIDATLWVLSVPEAYKQDACNAVAAVAPHWVDKHLTEKNILKFICDLQRWILANVEPK